jgi:hypothetical protein
LLHPATHPQMTKSAYVPEINSEASLNVLNLSQFSDHAPDPAPLSSNKIGATCRPRLFNFYSLVPE